MAAWANEHRDTIEDFFRNAGVVDLPAVGCRWDSPEELAAEMPTQVKGHAPALWQLGDRAARAAAQAAARRRLHDHAPETAPATSRPSSLPPARPVPAPRRPGQLHATVKPVKGQPQQRASVAPALVPLLATIWALIAGSQASGWAEDLRELDDKGREDFRTTWAAGLADTPLQPLRHRIKVWAAWTSFAELAHDDPMSPKPRTIAEYLRGVSVGGPTAAAGQAAALGWMGRVMRLQLGLTHALVAPFTKAAPHHLAQQDPMLMPELVHLETLLSAKNVLIAWAAAVVLTLVVSGLRYAHAQRSTLHGTLPGVWVGWCNRGKSKDARQGFFFAVPQVGVLGDFVGPRVLELLQTAWTTAGSSGCLFPDYGPSRVCITQATAWCAQRLPYSRFCSMFTVLMQLPPLQYKGDRKETSYRCRRWLPTMANLLKMPPPELAAAMDWKEPGGAHKAAYSSTMMARYNGAKLTMSTVSKAACILGARSAATAADNYNLTFDELPGHLPALDKLRAQAAPLAHGLASLEKTREVPLKQLDFKPSTLPMRTSAIFGVDQEKEEDADSVGSAEEVEDDLLVEGLQYESLQWIAPSRGKLHFFSRSEEADNKVYGLCGRSMQLHSVEAGTGLQAARLLPNPWCPQCLRKQGPACERYIEECFA